MKSELHSKNQPHLFQLAVKEKNSPNNLKQNSNSSISFNDYPKYAYEQLIKPVEELPSDVLNESREVIFSTFFNSINIATLLTLRNHTIFM